MAKKKKIGGNRAQSNEIRDSLFVYSPSAVHETGVSSSEAEVEINETVSSSIQQEMESTGPKGAKKKMFMEEILARSNPLTAPQSPEMRSGVMISRRLGKTPISALWSDQVDSDLNVITEDNLEANTRQMINGNNVNNNIAIEGDNGKDSDAIEQGKNSRSESRSEDLRSFASLFSENRKHGNGLSLQFVPPLQNNAVSFTEEEWKEGEEFWKFALIGHVIGLNVKFKSMESYVNKTWGKISIPKVFLIKQGVFLFEFTAEKQMTEVLEAGPWFFGARPLILKPWKIDTDIDKIQDCSYPMWVQFPNLKLNLWSSSGISKIASIISNPITTDKLTALRQRLSYARVLLEVDLPLKEPLPDQIVINRPDGKSYTQKVVYELKPRWCANCKMVGHDTEHCRRNAVKKIWIQKSTGSIHAQKKSEYAWHR